MTTAIVVGNGSAVVYACEGRQKKLREKNFGAQMSKTTVGATALGGAPMSSYGSNKAGMLRL